MVYITSILIYNINYNVNLKNNLINKTNRRVDNTTAHNFRELENNNKKIINFLVKIVIQKLMCQISCIIKEGWFVFFLSQKRVAEKRKF